MSGAWEPGRLLGDWQLDPGLCLALGLTAAGYLLAAGRARRWPPRRTAAFLAGLAILLFALQSGLHRHGEQLLSVHMLQHLLITLVVPPLLWLGAPVSLAMRSLPPASRRSLVRLLHGPVGSFLSRPGVGWALLSAVLVGSHLPAVYDAALREPLLHELEHAVYLGAALLFWLALVGSEPLPRAASPLARVLALLAAMPPMALVGVALMAAERPAYPSYLEGAREWGVSALADQRLGGALMWIGGAAVLASATLVIAWSGLRNEEERQRLREAYADRRAAAAGGRS